MTSSTFTDRYRTVRDDCTSLIYATGQYRLASLSKARKVGMVGIVPDDCIFGVMEHYEEAIRVLLEKQQLLESQRETIDVQLKRIRTAIRLLNGDNVISDTEGSTEEQEQVSAGSYSPLESLMARYPDAKEALSQDYDPHANWRDRVLYAIVTLGGSAYVPQMAAFIHQRQPELDMGFVRRKITRIASDLSAMHVISSEREGTRNRYSI